MAAKRTEEGWGKYLASADRELTLEEFAVLEAAHACANTVAAADYLQKVMLELEQVNQRLYRLEQFLRAVTPTYPNASQQPALNGHRE